MEESAITEDCCLLLLKENFLWLIWSSVDMQRIGTICWNAEESDQRQVVVV